MRKQNWQKAFQPLIWGLVLTTIIPRFQGLALDLLFPLAGALLLLLGFRALRRENGWFQGAWLLSVLSAAILFLRLIADARLDWQPLNQSPWTTGLALAASLARLACLWVGLRSVLAKANLPPKAGAAGSLLSWYGLMSLLALSRYQGILVWAMPAAFLWILIKLNRLAKALDQAEYPFFPAPSRTPGWLLVLLLSGGLSACVACLTFFSAQFPMEWTPWQASRSPEAQAAAQNLLALGFPEEILADLEEGQILACRDAADVICQSQPYSLTPGEDDLLLTHAAVRLTGEPQQWIIFHHFFWQSDPGFWGADSIRLWPASRLEGWEMAGDFQGRLLYETSAGQTMAAPYYSLEMETVRSQTLFWDKPSDDVFAEFSLPKKGQNWRGYLCYSISARQEGWLIDSWINYTCQRRWKYPAETARQRQLKSGWLRESAFVTVQSALQAQTADLDGEYAYRVFSGSSRQE